MAKNDIESAHRLIPVHPADQPLQAMEWKGQIYVDPMLPFGLRSAPKLLNVVANVLEWHLRQRGIQHIFHYLPALTSSAETTIATGDCTTSSETNRGHGDRHDPGQDDGTGNPRCYHHLFAHSLTPTPATQFEMSISSTEVSEEGGTVASNRSPSSSNKLWWHKCKETARL